MKTNSNVSFPEARNQPRSGLSFAAAARAASSKSASTQTDASTQTVIVHCTCQSGPHSVNVAVATDPLVISRPMQTQDESVRLVYSPEQPRNSKNARRKARKAAEIAAKLVENTTEVECGQQSPRLQSSSPAFIPRAVHLNAVKAKLQSEPSVNRKHTRGDSVRALDGFEDSPPHLFVYYPLNEEDMDILDASDEELAPLQAFC